MKKNNIIIYLIFAIACIALLGIWYFTGLYTVDPTLDLVLSIVWVILLVIGVVVLRHTNKKPEDNEDFEE